MTRKKLKEMIESNPFGWSSKLKLYQDILTEIDEYLEKYFSKEKDCLKISEKAYIYLYNLKSKPLCKTCKKHTTKYLNINSGYRDYCSVKCMKNDPEIEAKIKQTKYEIYGNANFTNREKNKKTCLERFGCENVFQNETIKKKIKKTNLEKYSVEYVSQSKEIRKNIKKTCLEKYGVENILQSKEIREKSKKTNLEKYGCENVFQNENIKKKIKKTNLEKYRAENVFSNKDIQEKIKKTNLEKYGVEYPIQSKEIQEKSKKTNLKKYGVEFSQQNHDIRLKQQLRYFYDTRYFDSSPEIALYIYLKDNHIDFEYQPDVSFEYLDDKNKLHKYFPDFRIEDKFYEIKGDQFFDKNNKMINPFNRNQDILYESKQKCMIDNNIIIFRSKDYQKYLDYIIEKYGKNYLQLFKNKK